MPQDPTTHPTQEEIKFIVGYANVYVDRVTQHIELGARVYRSPTAAEERRRNHPARSGLAFVGVFPMSAVVPDASRLAALQNAPPVANTAPDDEEPLENPEDNG